MPRDVDVWVVSLDRSDAEVERLYGLLLAEERERAGEPPYPPRKRRYVVRQGVTREILSRYTGEAPDALRLVRSTAGKPKVAGVRDLRFSVSDSGDLALVAVARRAVGVDVERVRRRRAAAGADGFFERWTRLEAVGKLRGTGLFGARGEHGLTCTSVDVGPRFAAAVAVAGEGLDVRLRSY